MCKSIQFHQRAERRTAFGRRGVGGPPPAPPGVAGAVAEAGGPALAGCALWAAAAVAAAAAFLPLPLLLPEGVGCCDCAPAPPPPPPPPPPPAADGVGVAAGVGCWPGPPPPLVEPAGDRAAAPPDADDAEASVDCWPFRLRGFFAGFTLSAHKPNSTDETERTLYRTVQTTEYE